MSPRTIQATPEILERFYGVRQERTVRAIASVLGEEPLAVAGLYQDGERVVLFADISPTMRESFVYSGMKFARAVVKMVKATGGPVFVLASENVVASARFLEHMGFKPVEGRVYQWAP